MPTPRGGLAAAVLNGEIYAIGGEAAVYSPLATLEIYNPVFNAWRTAPGLPTALWGLAATDANGFIYTTGGAIVGGITGPAYLQQNLVSQVSQSTKHYLFTRN
jgi:hypothetical protein